MKFNSSPSIALTPNRGEHIATDGNDCIRSIGAAPSDELFTGTSVGTLNVTKIWEEIWSRRTPAKLRTINLDANAMMALKGTDIDKRELRKMTPERINQPVLMIAMDDGTHALIDGNHRLTKRHELRLETFQMWEIPASALQRYAVQTYKLIDGQWVLLTPRQLLERAMGKYPVLENGKVVGWRTE